MIISLRFSQRIHRGIHARNENRKQIFICLFGAKITETQANNLEQQR